MGMGVIGSHLAAAAGAAGDWLTTLHPPRLLFVMRRELPYPLDLRMSLTASTMFTHRTDTVVCALIPCCAGVGETAVDTQIM